MILRAMVIFGALLGAPETMASQCREITSSTYIETRHPNGAVSMEKVKEGEKFIVIQCSPEGAQVWCYVMDLARTAFTVRRFLETDRLDPMHSTVVAFDACLAAD
jgi:hypothetical protein